MKFLHISDVHLGCTRYQLPESPRDFFDAWIDVLKRYGIEEKVDFVIMCGDFFHKRSVPPETMNYAVAGLQLMKDAGIPVVAIEGNHDQKHTDSEYSWLRSLANWNLLYLLEPTNIDGRIVYNAWDAEFGMGGFIDIGRVRIFGSHWYGASANWAIPMLTEAIKENRRDDAFHLLMLHTDVEGHQTHPIPALSLSALKELKSVTDYVALGHTHMHYEIDNWAFNPGSIEVTNIAEFREKRGVFLVDVDDRNAVTARHIEEYHYRPFQRIPFDVDGFAATKDLTAAVLETVSRKARRSEEGKPAPIIEIILKGQLGFPNSVLELKEIREKAKEITGALHIRIKNNSVPTDYAVAADIDEDASRDALERRVVEDLIIRDDRYKTKVIDISDAVIGAKRLALSDEEPEKIAEFIAAKIALSN
ncbi:MAG: exonuclease SbcCD subunit D [Pyrinomonadaceae bacterium]|nr:exonuclease SbcCD subunit D [Blastocatellia bacterium]MCW5955298.1 exonuclease SbcCD subunit D [Pyrinomonadaceae bacterium]